MDFFGLQERARRRTFHLLVLYFLAVGAVVLFLFLATAALIEAFRLPFPRPEIPRTPAWRDSNVFGWVLVYAFLIIGGGVLFRWLDLRREGGGVAGMFGASRIDPSNAGHSERRLINVVEEMAIASGIPVPEIYVLARQRGINAFAAGSTLDNATVVLTRGAVDHLSRSSTRWPRLKRVSSSSSALFHTREKRTPNKLFAPRKSLCLWNSMLTRFRRKKIVFHRSSPAR